MPHKRKATTTAAIVAVAALAALAGCLDRFAGAEEASGPQAVLDASPPPRWVGEPVTFDGQSSRAGDGDIVSWRFDFGDGTVVEVDREDEARLQHAYTRPGVYTATLTVEARDGDEARRDSASLELGVGERVPVEAAVVKDPLVGAAANHTVPFQAGQGASAYAVNLTASGSATLGESRLRVEVLDPTGAVLASKEVTVGSAEEEDVLLEGDLPARGTHTLRLQALTGALEVTGEIRVSYDGA